MTRAKPFWTGLLWVLALTARAQEPVYLSLFSPNFAASGIDANHRIELFNESVTDRFDLGGWCILTRQYAIRLPGSTYIQPLRSLSLGMKGADVLLGKGSAIRYREAGTGDGDFVMLLTPEGKVSDAFYFALTENAGFLSARISLPAPNGPDQPFVVPPQTDRCWRYLPASPDPALSFVRIANGWRIQSRRININPATEIDELRARYAEGRVRLSWETNFEADCYFFRVERSPDNREFGLVSRIPGRVNQKGLSAYQFEDTTAVRGRVYYYRIKNTDKFGNEVLSPTARVRTEEQTGGLNLAIQRAAPAASRMFDLKFSSATEQTVRINLLDEELREVAVLFDGTVEARKEHLIRLKQSLPIGRYIIVISTDTQKYYEQVVLD